MKIGQSPSQSNPIGNTESSIEIKKGDILSSTIKERLPNNESIIQVRGKDVRVKFEGSVPTNDKVTIQVVGVKDDVLQVRAVAEGSKGQSLDSDISRVLKSLGATATPELRTAVKFLLDRGVPLSRESVADLKAFLGEKPGNVTRKLETIKAIANKGLELTPIHLRSVHAALHGEPLGNQLANFADALGLDLRSGTNEVNVATEVSSQRDVINQSIEVAPRSETKAAQEAAVKEVREMVRSGLNLGDTVDQYQLSDELLAGLKPETKDIVITHVTQRMAEATEQFKDLKREVTRKLDNMIRFADGTRMNIFPQTKQVMESTIDLIDKAILKSDFVMFADMATEKQLMTVSMDLASAKKYLANGQNDQAAALLSKIKTKLVELNWRPSDVKVRHVLINEQTVRVENYSNKQELSRLIDHVTGPQSQEGSARGTFELIRSLGLNYDSEVAQSLVTAHDKGNEEHLQQNMKAAIMKLVGNEGDQSIVPGVDQQVKDILQNLTGQQLLNRSETSSPLQTMFFSLPLMMGANMETVKLYVNGKKDGQKIDWENCSLYFLIDTKKIGETGILLIANNRNLSITIKNDRQELKQKMETLIDKCKGNLKEIGYNITAINFTRLSNEREMASEKSSESSVPLKRTTTKGFDFSI